MTTRRTYCFKLYRNKRLKNLHRQISLAGEIYNHCIALHKRCYRLYKKHLNSARLQQHLAKLKKQERYKSRGIEGVIKTLTIKRDALGDLYVCFSCVLERQAVVFATTGNSAGFDFGLKTFLVALHGTETQSPLFFRQNAQRIKSTGKRLSSKKAGSNNSKRARRSCTAK